LSQYIIALIYYLFSFYPEFAARQIPFLFPEAFSFYKRKRLFASAEILRKPSALHPGGCLTRHRCRISSWFASAEI